MPDPWENTMPDDVIRAAEFNAAMRAVKDSMDLLTQRIAAMESLNQANLMAKVNEARAEGEAEGRSAARMEALEKRIDRQSNILNALTVTAAGQLLYWVISHFGGTK